HCLSYTGCDEVYIGQHEEAEKCLPAYDLVEVDYQIIHAMRGCPRECNFCGIWKIEKLSYKNAEQIKNEINSNKIIFYDNNILVNPHIEEILKMLASFRYNDRVLHCECQSGFDGRVIEEIPEILSLLKEARFQNIRVAWDFKYEQYEKVENWIYLLEQAGFKRKDVFIFMIYNWNYNFELMEKKRQKCFEFGVQIADCRYRPLDQTFDNYNPRLKKQTAEDYYIHSCWTDSQIRQFRRNVRQHNICIRHDIPWNGYSAELERSKSRKKQQLSIINV
ncbi:MAG: Fe-S oxidoreductase, partial [Victivallaceae bacterium]